MEYGKILNRSVNIVWQSKFLIILGILAAFGASLFSGGSGTGDLGQFLELGDEIVALVVGITIAIVCAFLFIVIGLWVISTIARGGLIASVDTIESGEKSSFRQAWSAGWRKAWTLLGIGLLPAIPGLILFMIGLMALGVYGGIFALFDEEFVQLGTAGLGITIAVFACILIPIMLVLSILRNFAERACMLEDLGVIDAYRRGTSVLMANFGEAVILFLLQIVIFIVLGVLLFIPGLVLVLCFILWPLLLVVKGFTEAFVSALWTLAWRAWTGETPMTEKAPSTV